MGSKPLVFLGWSGAKSQAVAKVFHTWMQNFIQGCEPWMSSEDIDIGKPWRDQLNRTLSGEGTSVGVFILTRRNQAEPWVLFEYGRLSADANKLCPPLCCDFHPAEIKGPLAEQQGVPADKEGILRMLMSIDKHLSTEVGEAVLTRAFESLWDGFSADLKSALAVEDGGEDPGALEQRKVPDMIKEILERMRHDSAVTMGVYKMLTEMRGGIPGAEDRHGVPMARKTIGKRRELPMTFHPTIDSESLPNWIRDRLASMPPERFSEVESLTWVEPDTWVVRFENTQPFMWRKDEKSKARKTEPDLPPF